MRVKPLHRQDCAFIANSKHRFSLALVDGGIGIRTPINILPYIAILRILSDPKHALGYTQVAANFGACECVGSLKFVEEYHIGPIP